MFWFGLVWFGLVWFGLVWSGLVWFVWFRLVWFGLIFVEYQVCTVRRLAVLSKLMSWSMLILSTIKEVCRVLILSENVDFEE